MGMYGQQYQAVRIKINIDEICFCFFCIYYVVIHIQIRIYNTLVWVQCISLGDIKCLKCGSIYPISLLNIHLI